MKNDKYTKEEKVSSKKKKNKKPRRILKTILLFIMICIILAGSFLGYKVYKNGGGLSGFLATLLGESSESLEDLDPIQILIMGESGVDSYKLADTIMVASYNPKTQEASLMSIPRDTYVGAKNRKTATQNYIASYKINAVFKNGTNIDEAMTRINAVTTLNLKNYVIIDTKALVKLVDAIGGITFDVPIDMDYDDTSQDLHIHLKAGEQLIDGEKAEQLLRFRHNNNGTTYPSEYGQQDLGRMKTQREFVTETLKQTLKPQNIFKLKQIIDIMNSNINTNIDMGLIKKYIPYSVNFNAENLKTGMVPGDVEMCNGVSIYVANKAETTQLVNELFPIDTDKIKNKETNSKIKMEILNGSGNDDKLKEVVEILKEEGYTISNQGNINTTEKSSIINRTNQEITTTNKIKDILDIPNISKGTNTTKADVTIILGRDY